MRFKKNWMLWPMNLMSCLNRMTRMGAQISSSLISMMKLRSPNRANSSFLSPSNQTKALIKAIFLRVI
jgi:hypothetical protein